MKQSADVRTWHCAVGAGIVPLCPGWAVLGDEASQTGEVRMSPTFPSAATVLDNARPHAGTFGSKSLLGEDRVVSRTRPPAHSVLASSALRHDMQHVVPFSASIRRRSLKTGTCRATFYSSQTGLLLLLRLTAPPSALWCHREVSEGDPLLAEMLGPVNSDHTRMEQFTTCGSLQALDSWEDQTRHQIGTERFEFANGSKLSSVYISFRRVEYRLSSAMLVCC